MRFSSLSLSVLFSLAVLPSWAQSAEVPAGVRATELAIQIPDIAPEVSEAVAPAIRLAQELAGMDKERLALLGQRAAYAATLAQTLKQYTTRVTGVDLNPSPFYSPEMAKKTREIALLRQMLVLKLSARDIEKALPILHEMKDSDKVVPVKPEQAMEEEYNRLLRAKPGDPIPESSATALRDAAGNFRNRKQALWDKMGQEIGKEKAAGIKAMLRSEGVGSWITSGSGNHVFTVPGAATPFLSPPRRAKPATKPPKDEKSPDEPESVIRLNADDTVISQARPRILRTADPVSEVEIVTTPAVPVRPARSRASSRIVQPVDPAQDTTIEAPAARRQVDREVQRTQRVQRSVSTTLEGVTISPSARILSVGPNGQATRWAFGNYGQVSLDELIDLFERKLAALRR